MTSAVPPNTTNPALESLPELATDDDADIVEDCDEEGDEYEDGDDDCEDESIGSFDPGAINLQPLLDLFITPNGEAVVDVLAGVREELAGAREELATLGKVLFRISNELKKK